FLTAMRMKGETEDELVGFAQVMIDSATKISAPPNCVDLCGTGGDGSGTFNISTVASFVVSAADVPVAKHGNRSVSSRSGSADLMDALGIPYDLTPESVQACLDSASFGFMFAPVFHPSMKNVVGPRREIGTRTFFNLLGPMTNPAGVRSQLMGVYDPGMTSKLARVLSRLGVRRAMVVNGAGMDEISNLGVTRVAELRNGELQEYTTSPGEFGFDLAEPKELSAGSSSESARIALSVLKGERSPRADVVLMNAAAAIYVAGAAADMHEGLVIASEAVRSGKALRKLKQVATFAQKKEEERQLSLRIDDLRSRRILPSVLTKRCREITSHLVDKIISQEGGSQRLARLDSTIVNEPSILSVLSLSRLLSVMTSGVSTESTSHRSTTRFSEAISEPGISVIGEYKPRAPSAPSLYVPPSWADAADTYERSRMAAMSVLVEPEFFGGSPELFRQVRERTRLPLLYKDFVVTEEQVSQAQGLGADSILLIAKALDQPTLDEFIESCLSKKVQPLVELHDKSDLNKLLACSNLSMVRMVGLNSRDLRTMGTDLSNMSRLMKSVPSDKLLIAESGIQNGEEVASLHGFDAVLVGTALMTADNLQMKAEELVSAGRRAAS
ncbi:MAG TPA: anthranilate phosphoribosyltransferase, partial [Thermoplasmata archaeon]